MTFMKSLLQLLLFLSPGLCSGQSFDFAAKEAVKIPTAVTVQIRQYIEKHDGINLLVIKNQYQYVPVFNVLARSQKQFVDGIYYFTWGSHDSGRLFINQKGKLSFLRNGSTADILADYSNYLKQHPLLTETTQIAYLSAIAAFMKFRYQDQQMLIESGAVQEVK